MLGIGDREEDGGLCVANILAFFKIGGRRISESRKYAFQQCMEVARSTDIVDWIHLCDILRWQTDGEVDHSLRQGTSSLEK